MLLQAISFLSALAGPSLAKFVSQAELSASYDFVVVGSGTGGATVASRLSESKATVLLIEAGELDKKEPYVVLPSQAGAARYTQYDWNYTAIEQPLMNNRSIAIPQGKVVGGSTVLNGMAFDRGSASDYDAWAELDNPGWTFKELLPYFKKSEKFTPPSKELAEKWNITWDPEAHGYDGPIHSSYPDHFSAQHLLLKRALEALNIPKQIDGHGGLAFNHFWSPNALDGVNKSRSYSRNYVELAIERPNFHVLLGTQVTKLVTDKVGETVRVTAVEFSVGANATRATVKVDKEVVVSGGAIGSVRVLQGSGIGPAKVLEAAKVPVVVDLPGVGTNYQDHPFVFTNGQMSNAPSDPVISNDQARDMYYANRTGPWTVSGPTNFAFIPLNKVTDKSKEILDALSSQDAATFLPSGAHPSVVAGWDAQRKILAKHLSTDTMGASEIVQLAGLAAPGPGHLVSFQHPFSRGYVAIKSADPFEYPTIDLRYSTNPLDWNVTIETLRFTRKLMAVSPMAETKYLELVPGIQLTTDAQLQTYFASRLSTMFHSCCTNPMQPLARGGVVDAKLKVYGVANLRIADVSIIPLIPATHTQSSVYAIGEKAADLIKAEYSL